MVFDDILLELGEFGRYQKRIYILLCLPIPFLACHILLSVFTLAVPEHRCAIPYDANRTDWAVNSTEFLSLAQDDYQAGKCTIATDNITVETCHKWIYDQSDFTSTVVTQFDWVCDRDTFRTYASTVYVVGMLLGAAVFGPLADVIGRKVTFYFGNIMMTVCSIVTIWAPEFYSFSLFRLLDGVMGVPVFVSSYYIGLEFVGPSKRMHAGVVIEYFFASGLVILAGLAYLIRDWTHLQLAVALPGLFFLSYWWLIPESPRWLLTQGRNKEAEAIVLRAAMINRVMLPDKFLKDMSDEVQKSTGRFWQVFRTPKLAIRSIIMIFNWMVVSMCYYGLSLNTGNLNGNIYLNFFLSGLIEFPAIALCQLLLNRTGRKKLFVSSLLLGGLACVVTVFPVLYLTPDNQWVTVTLSLVGKLGAAAAFCIVYIYCGEIFPTVIRAQSTAMCIVAARIGTIISSYITAACASADGEIGKVLPLVIFGVASLMSGSLSMLLPETMNKRLPETMKDFTNFTEIPDINQKNGAPLLIDDMSASLDQSLNALPL